MESFAVTLDGVIGQAFEEWGTPKSTDRARPVQSKSQTGRRNEIRELEVSNKSSSVLKQTHMTSFMNSVSKASGKSSLS